jgi:hypothetical protein
MTDPVEPDKRREDAGFRKEQFRTIKALLADLKRARRRWREFYKLTGEPIPIRFARRDQTGEPIIFGALWADPRGKGRPVHPPGKSRPVYPARRVYLPDALESAIDQVTPWTRKKGRARSRPAPTKREWQQLRLLRRVHDEMNGWYLSEAENFLSGIYTHQLSGPPIPLSEYPTARSLRRLVKRFLLAE